MENFDPSKAFVVELPTFLRNKLRVREFHGFREVQGTESSSDDHSYFNPACLSSSDKSGQTLRKRGKIPGWLREKHFRARSGCTPNAPCRPPPPPFHPFHPSASRRPDLSEQLPHRHVEPRVQTDPPRDQQFPRRLGPSGSSSIKIWDRLNRAARFRDSTCSRFSGTYEMDDPHVLDVLEFAGLPIQAADRRDADQWPLVVMGGVLVSVNRLPLYPFIDAFLHGDSEVVLPPVLEALARGSVFRNHRDRLEALEGLPGVELTAEARLAAGLAADSSRRRPPRKKSC